MACLETQKHPSHTSPTSTGNSTSPALLESKLTFDQRKSKKNETSVTETTAAATTEVDVSTGMTVEVDLTETIEADDLSAMIVEITAAIGIAPSVTTTISLSGRNAIDAVNQEETVVADQTTEDSNAEMTDVVATDLVAMTDAVVTEEETTARTTEWTATGIAPSATMTTLHGELNATNVELQRAAVEDDLLAEMTDVVATDLVATTDVVATDVWWQRPTWWRPKRERTTQRRGVQRQRLGLPSMQQLQFRIPSGMQPVWITPKRWSIQSSSR
jgi:hypothetical protein